MRNARRSGILAALLCVPCMAFAGELRVRVVADDQPVANAVVTLDQEGLAPLEFAAIDVMDQQDRQFQPFVLAIPRGAAVNFPNSDNIRHHVYSFSTAKRFELRLYSGTPAAPVIFDKPGIVTLGCNIHDWMLGFIYVTDAARFVVTDASGEAIFDDLKAAPARIEIWQPRMQPRAEPQRHVVQLTDDDTEETVVVALGPPVRQPAPDDRPSALDRRRRN